MREKILYLFIVIIIVSLNLYCSNQDRGITFHQEKEGPDCRIGKQYAILIAVDHYTHWLPLIHPVKDAKEIRGILEKRYYMEEIRTIYDEKATKEGIIKSFEDLKNELKGEDSLLIYYAGHGHMDDNGEGYWIPVDGGDLNENETEHWIENSLIRQWMRDIKAKHILLISDSCFSGNLLEIDRGPIPFITNKYFQNAYSFRSRQVITSSALEPAPDNSEFSTQLKSFLENNRSPYLDPLMIFIGIRPEIKKTFPLYGQLQSIGHEKGASFLFFLKEGGTKIEAVREKIIFDVLKYAKAYYEARHYQGAVDEFQKIPDYSQEVGADERELALAGVAYSQNDFESAAQHFMNAYKNSLNKIKEEKDAYF